MIPDICYTKIITHTGGLIKQKKEQKEKEQKETLQQDADNRLQELIKLYHPLVAGCVRGVSTQAKNRIVFF